MALLTVIGWLGLCAAAEAQIYNPYQMSAYGYGRPLYGGYGYGYNYAYRPANPPLLYNLGRGSIMYGVQTPYPGVVYYHDLSGGPPAIVYQGPWYWRRGW